MAENICLLRSGIELCRADLSEKKKKRRAAVKHFHLLSIRIQGFRKDFKVSGS